jgi:hypothetical protein
VYSGTYLVRAFGWALVSGALLLAGLFAFELLLASTLMLRSGSWGFSYRQWELTWLLFETFSSQLLIPHLLATWALWLGLARLVPALEGSWRWICAGTPLVAALSFPLIAEYSLAAWTPELGRGYLAALLLMSGVISGALLLTRGLVPALEPGAFARP